MTGWIVPLMLCAVLGESPVVRDVAGKIQRVEVADDEQLLVVALLGVECPLARLYARRLNELAMEYTPRGVRWLAIDSLAHDSAAELRRFAAEHQLAYPIAKDLGTTLADRWHVERTPAVVVLDRLGQVRYRGRVDDQYQLGTRRAAAESHDLRRALDELLSGRPVTVPETTATGCLISRRASQAGEQRITYEEHIAPLFQARCVRCHRTGGMGPMPLDRYEEIAGWGAMIAEVVENRRMPPWHADPQFGHFANDASLTFGEREQIAAWVAAGYPRGTDEDAGGHGGWGAGVKDETANVANGDWEIGKPDAVIAMPVGFRVPAAGVIEYQTFDVDPYLKTDRWVTAVEVRPGNRAVVHHCNVFLCPPGSSDAVEAGAFGSVCLAAMAAGTGATEFPPGMAKRLPAGWRVRFVMHYVPNGVEQTDRTELGLKFCPTERVTHEVATRLMVDEQLRIPAGTAAHRVEHAALCERDMLLLAMFPHLHLRGKSFQYEAEYPDGRREMLLKVPRWDFNWQHRYELAEPKRLPAGTILRCTAVYDNSAANPANPDPTVDVRTGPRSEDEMFNGYYDVAIERSSAGALQPWSVWLARGALLSIIGAVAWRRAVRMKKTRG